MRHIRGDGAGLRWVTGAAISLAFASASATAVAAPTFAPSPGSTRAAEPPGSTRFYAVAAARRTGAATADLAVASYRTVSGTDRLRALVLRGGGSGVDVFTSTTEALSANGRADDVAFGDVDGDGDQDIALATDNSLIRVLRDVGGVFDPGAGTAYQDGNRDVELGDVTGDGRADLVSVGYGTVYVRVSNGNGTFGAATQFTTGDLGTPEMIVGDVTGDGRADVMTAFGSSGRLFPGRATGAPLGPATPVNSGNGGPRDIALGDVDANGSLDLLAVNVQSTLTVVRNTGGGAFLAPVTYPAGGDADQGSTATVVALDADLDGDDDVVTADDDARLRVREALAGGQLAAPVELARGSQQRSVAAGDFDGDGRPDLGHLSTFSGVEEIRVLRNTTPIVPRVSAPAVTDITTSTAVVRATVKTVEPGASVKVRFGPTTSYGRESGAVAVAARQAAAGVEIPLDGLAPGTRYEAQIVAENAGGSTAATTSFTTPLAPAPDTTVGVELLSLTGAPATATIADAPTAVRVRLAGASGPWSLAVDWGKDEGPPESFGGVTDTKLLTHAFRAAPPLNPAIVRQSGPRTAYRTVTVTATDRFGRTATGTALVIVRPDTAPTAAIGSAREVLQYGARNELVSLSRDADAPADAIVREQWTMNGLPRDIPFPTPSPCATARPPVVDAACLASRATLLYTPWEESLKALGRGPIADLKLPSTAGVVIPELKLANGGARAQALESAAQALCDLCREKPDPKTVRLTVTDRSGRTDTAERTFPVRTPDKPLADGTVVLGGGDEFVSAITADSPEEPGTPVRIDPSRSTADDGLKPAWYVLEVGTPWQSSSQFGKCLTDAKKVAPGAPRPGLSREDLDPFLGGYPGDGFSGTAGITGQIRRASAPVSQGDKFGDCAAYKGDFGVKDPVVVIVTKDPAQLAYTTPKPGKFAALLTVYDRYGQRDKLRFDGLDAMDASTDCVARGFRVGSASGGLNVSGTCISSRTTGPNRELAWSTEPILVNGLELAPEAGASWVIDARQGPAAAKLYAARGVPTSPATWGTAGSQTLAAADLRIAGSSATRLRPDPFCTAKVPVPTKQTPEAAGAPAFCTDAPDARELPAAASARYQGLAIVGQITMVTEKLSGSNGRSVLTFQVELPDGFGPVDAAGNRVGPAPTGLTTLNGLLAVKGVVVTTTNQTRATLRGTGRRAAVVGRAAAVGQGTGKLLVEQGAFLAGFALGRPLKLDIDPATGSGTAETAIEIGPVGEVEVQVTLTGGRLTGVAGSLSPSPGIPIGGGAFVSKIAFNVQTAPRVVLVGQVTVGHNLLVPATTTPAAVQIVGTVSVQPDPFVLKISGNAQLLSVPLAEASVVVSAAQIAISASVGTRFGPASVSATIEGDVGAYGFNLRGRGSTCLGICLGTDLLVSSRGAAACGEIKLLVTEVSFGFGAIYSPFNVDLYATGCSVEPYRANPTSRAVAGTGRLDGGPLGQGATRTFAVTEDDLPTLIVVASSVGGPGAAPRVTLRGPAGAGRELRTFSSPGVAEDFASVQPGVFAQADPETGATRFVVDKPRKGTWSLTTEAGSPPVGAIRLGQGVKEATTRSFKGTRVLPTSTATAAAEVRRRALQGTGLLGRTVRSPAKRRAVVALAAAAPRRTVRRAPLVRRGTVPIGAAEVDVRDLRRAMRISVAAALRPGDRVTFSERGPGVRQQLGQYVVPANGRLLADLYFDPARAPERRRVIDAYVTTGDGVPRGRIDAVATFRADPIVAKDPPDIRRVERRGTTRTLVFAKGASYPKSVTSEWRLTATGSLGTRITRTISGSDLRRGPGGTARFTLKGIPKNETFTTLRVVGLNAAGRSSPKGAELARSVGTKLAAPKRRR